MTAEKLGEEQEGRRRRRPFGQKEKIEETPAPAVVEKGVTAGKGRATPSRRRAEDEEEDEGNVIQRTGGGLAEYVQGVRSELDKVVWPTRDEWQRLTIIVLGTLVGSAIILGIISAAFTELFRIGLGAPGVLFGFMILAIAAGIVIYRKSNQRSSPY
jgi:preprotein translocase SecE subunit